MQWILIQEVTQTRSIPIYEGGYIDAMDSYLEGGYIDQMDSYFGRRVHRCDRFLFRKEVTQTW